MPKFLEVSQLRKKAVLNSNERQIAEAAQIVKWFSEEIETERLYILSHKARIDEYLHDVEKCFHVINGVIDALTREKVNRIDLQVRKYFALPPQCLLSLRLHNMDRN